MTDQTLGRELCEAVGSPFNYPEESDIVGLAFDPDAGTVLNGLRHPMTESSGWFVWNGERDTPQGDADFKPVCVEHACKQFPVLKSYLGLGAGWRFLVASGYQDVWHDPALLDV